MDNTTKQHYYMACAYLTFVPVTAGKTPTVDEINKAHLNSVFCVLDDDGKPPCITAKHLTKAQESLQLQLHAKTEGTEIDVLDLTFTGFFYLGLMTPAEFLNTPCANDSTVQ